MTLQEAFELAVQFQQQRRFSEAESIYRQILQHEPSQPDVLHLLGVLAHQTNRHEEAIRLIRQALATQPKVADYHNHLGLALAATGKPDEALEAYRQALELNPNLVGARNNLGLALKELGRLDEAIQCYDSILKEYPQFADARANLGNALRQKGLFEEAISAYRTALQSHPAPAAIYNNLGGVLREAGRTVEAVDSFREAIRLKPDFAEAYYGLGNSLAERGDFAAAMDAYRTALQLKPDYDEAITALGLALAKQGRFSESIVTLQGFIERGNDKPETQQALAHVLRISGRRNEAIQCLRHAIELNSNSPETWNQLAITLREVCKLDEAVSAHRHALEIQPDFAAAYSDLGNALREQGKIEEAIAAFRKAMELEPEVPTPQSNLLMTLHLDPECGAEYIDAESRRWNEKHARHLKPAALHFPNDRNPDRRLRVGYVSPDFTGHPVGRFLLPLLENHDHAEFEIYCYSDVEAASAMTECLRSHSDVWRTIVHRQDGDVADLIRRDQIDVLVDLAAHTANNRLLVFARRVAPVQVSYLAYPGTTGLDTMDYRITDPYLDPPEENRNFYSEESIYLPANYWCYQRPDGAPAASTLPALQNGYVTFGSLNNFCKVSNRALAAWAEILRSVAGSQLLLHANEGSHRERVLSILGAVGITADRIQFTTHLPPAQYFALYRNIDIFLDPFPCAGGTTTCDALWMGVPVITLAGDTAVARGGVSILSNAGLSELIAKSEQDYVEIATRLAGDLPRLEYLRAGMRDRIANSPLMNAKASTRAIEKIYRRIWKRWCINSRQR